MLLWPFIRQEITDRSTKGQAERLRYTEHLRTLLFEIVCLTSFHDTAYHIYSSRRYEKYENLETSLLARCAQAKLRVTVNWRN